VPGMAAEKPLVEPFTIPATLDISLVMVFLDAILFIFYF